MRFFSLLFPQFFATTTAAAQLLVDERGEINEEHKINGGLA